MMDGIARFFLFFTDSFVVILLLILGFLTESKTKYCQAASLTLFSVILNTFLKAVFHIKTSSDADFAFPSGHMQCGVVLYGFLAIQSSNLLYKIMTIIIISGIGMSLVHFSYHTLFQVLGGVGAGLALLGVYSLVLRSFSNYSFWLLAGSGFLIIQGTKLLYPFVPDRSWQAYYLLLGIVVLQETFNSRHIQAGIAKLLTWPIFKTLKSTMWKS